MPLFLIFFFFLNDTGRNICNTYCCMDVDWKHRWSRIEAGLRVECYGFIWVLRSKSGLEPLPRTSEALTAQYLNVHHCKLGTMIIKTVHILQHDSAVTGLLPEEDFLHGQPNILPIFLAWQKYYYTSVPTEAVFKLVELWVIFTVYRKKNSHQKTISALPTFRKTNMKIQNCFRLHADDKNKINFKISHSSSCKFKLIMWRPTY